jgi:hypothetical protein
VHHEEEDKQQADYDKPQGGGTEPEPVKLWPWEQSPTVADVNKWLGSPEWKGMAKEPKDALWKQIAAYAKSLKWTLHRDGRADPFEEEPPTQSHPTTTKGKSAQGGETQPTTTNSASASTATKTLDSGTTSTMGTDGATPGKTTSDPELAKKLAACQEWLNKGPSCEMVDGYLMDVNDGPQEHQGPLNAMVTRWAIGQGWQRNQAGKWQVKVGGVE